MILYHGSTVVVQEPQILKSERGRDFGFAFCTTDIKEQAERWAKRKALIERRKGNEKSMPIVTCFEWDKEQSMKDYAVRGCNRTPSF